MALFQRRPGARGAAAGIAAALALGLVSETAALQERQAPEPAAQGELVIEVRAGDAPLEGSLVRVAGRSLRSDAAGQARFALPAGAHTIRVSADGFQDATSSATVGAGTSVSLQVSLTPARQKVVLSVFTANHYGAGDALEEAIGRVAEQVAAYFAYRQ